LEALEQKVAELNRELGAVKEKLDDLDSQAQKWAEKRSSVHERIKKLQAEASDLRSKRDALNEKVHELKGLREKARKKQKENRVKTSKLSEELKALMKRKPPLSMGETQRKIGSLEWKIQTSSLTLEEEKPLVEQVKYLETQLLVHKQIQKLKGNINELRTQNEKLEAEAKSFHEQLSEVAEQSQTFHEKSLEILNQIRAIRVQADVAHTRYVWTTQQSQELHKKYVNIAGQIKSLKQKLRRAEERKKAERQTELLTELEKKALEKLKRGEKLTLEEFKVLAEKGILK